jgi:anti-anti-sigma regulatory factor
MLRPEKLASRIMYAEMPSTAPDSTLVVGVIDDPELAMRLLSVRGAVNATSLEALATAFSEVRDCSRLYVDLTDAEFSDPSVTSSLAGLLDELDDRRVHLRIVGLGRLAAMPVD